MGTLFALIRALSGLLAALLNWIGSLFGRPQPLVTVESGQMTQLQGRWFELQILRSRIGGNHYRVLQIAGDGIVISFHAKDQSPNLAVSAPAIRYGSHVFEVLPQPNHYRIDGTDHQLGAPGVYALSGPRFLGRIF